MKKIKLTNGLNIILEPMKKEKKSFVLINVGIGSKDESKKVKGISHFIEHLAFKSNKHRAAKQLMKDLEYAGTIVNAYTSYENTAYHGKCLSGHEAETLQILFEAIENKVYQKEEFDLEKQVVLTEIQNYEEFPDRLIIKKFFRDMYKNTQYEEDIGGRKETVSSISQEDIIDFKKQYYVPNNMTIVIAGNFKEKEVLRKIESTFGTLKKKSFKKDKVSEFKNKKLVKTHTKKELEQAFFCLGYKTPTWSKKESIVLELISVLLGEGLSSKMSFTLREENGIGYSVGTYYYNLGLASTFFTYVIGFDPKKERLAKKLVKDILKEISENEISSEELLGIKNYYLSHFLDETKNIDNIAQDILDSDMYKTKYNYSNKEEAIKKITKKDILNVAKKIFNDDFTMSTLKGSKK